MISSPWAKLTSRMIPKITAMPSANRAYRLPSAMASIASWMTSWAVTSASGARRQKPEVRGVEAAHARRARPACPRARCGRSAGRRCGPRAATVRLHVLLDQQDRRAVVADLGDRREHLVDEQRRQAQRRLVEQEEPRLGDQRPSDRELLLLAAGERPGRQPRRSCAAPGSARAPARAAASVRARSGLAVRPSSRFSPTVSVVKMWRPSSTSAMPRLAMSSVCEPGERMAEAGDGPAGDRHEPGDRGERRRLARAVRAHEADDLALARPERDVLRPPASGP